MKKLIEIENVGTIEANQSILTGHFAFNFNGKPMRQLSKKEYEYPSENGKESVNIVLHGNIFKGMSFLLKDKVYKISEPVQWYIFAFALLPFLISLVLGNMPSLAKEMVRAQMQIYTIGQVLKSYTLYLLREKTFL